MKRIILILVFALLRLFLLAQNNIDTTETRPINNINLNIFGDGSVISINYERLYVINPGFFITGKLGIGYYEDICLLFCSYPPNKHITIPHHITGNLGIRRNIFLEIGLGGTLMYGTNQHYFLYPIVGYRIQPLKSKNVNFRI